MWNMYHQSVGWVEHNETQLRLLPDDMQTSQFLPV